MMDNVSIAPLRISSDAADVVEFWKGAGRKLWFTKDPEFDRTFRERFAPLYERAARGQLEAWRSSPGSALALVLLLDQYPRNSFRGTPLMYATDQLAVHHASHAIAHGYDRRVDAELQFFFYLPFGHSESLTEQERGLALSQHFGAEMLKPAIAHAAIVRRFGRFPHRNVILGRPSSEEELEFLSQGGFAG